MLAAVCSYPDKADALPPLPEFGDLNLEEVNQSDYFFD